ncbi:molybdopterin molybdotransferase MoeA [Chelatococcus sp. SYSU_G07232]|uniref:Molybdopterin molybdenumtransferase n=1 Tax=Chelatococcus albus TaxID=3047466 RepID=A0ABT7ABW9_9HYPH|nr:gephyrin-like molybdotransferase Glp [Chelatococcus sp. SYSU_G07232]MDJ1156861.1 molybdopterin molybdotransferase MoeA [Chelatococcus sp. SYSU_G07232]
MSLLPVVEALQRVLASVATPVEAEAVPLATCRGRTLAADLAALRTQPPFPASAMDGYAVRAADVAALPATLRVIGTSAAGHGHRGTVGAGEAVRIFTGAPVPDGADTVVIQENTEPGEGTVLVREVSATRHIRTAGLDFRQGDVLIRAGRRLDARLLALAAAMGHSSLPVRRRPRVAILATGDELVPPGSEARPDQIVASNSYAVAAIVEEAGGEPIDLGIAGDSFAALEGAIARARAARADVLVTLGGASVGEHDLVQSALAREGMQLGFWRIAMRPGKPLMHGRLGDMIILGLPGNPVSSIVCSVLFVAPAVRALCGDPEAGRDPSEEAVLGVDLAANDQRQDYLRARLDEQPAGPPRVTPFGRQDSSMLATLAEAQALLIRPPYAPAATAGSACRIIRFDRR